MARKLIHLTQEDIDGATAGGLNCPVARALKRELGVRPVVTRSFWREDGSRKQYMLSSGARKIVETFDDVLPLQPTRFYVEV